MSRDRAGLVVLGIAALLAMSPFVPIVAFVYIMATANIFYVPLIGLGYMAPGGEFPDWVPNPLVMSVLVHAVFGIIYFGLRRLRWPG